MVTSLAYLEPVFNFCGKTADAADKTYLHQKSLQAWKTDSHFGFSLSNEVIELACKYGYQKDELVQETYQLWPLIRELSRARYKAKVLLKKAVRNGPKAIKRELFRKN